MASRSASGSANDCASLRNAAVSTTVCTFQYTPLEYTQAEPARVLNRSGDFAASARQPLPGGRRERVSPERLIKYPILPVNAGVVTDYAGKA
jgi:hypothetical protein